MLRLWPCDLGPSNLRLQPIFHLDQHKAAVKGIAWCPWQSHILASGGGLADGTIKLWNVNNGTCLSTTDSRSQICGLLWSSTFKEIVSGQGFSKNQLIIWKYPEMTKVTELTGHTRRVLHLAMSPDGSTVVSAGADETLRFWKCFQSDPRKKRRKSLEIKSISSKLRRSIR